MASNYIDLPSYTTAESDVTADYLQGEKFQTPYDTFVETQFEHGLEYGITKMGLNRFAIDTANTQQYRGVDDDGELIPNMWIDAATANKKYGIRLNEGQRISEAAAERLSELKKRDTYRQEAMAAASQDLFTQGSGMAANLVGNMLDPINIGAAFIPIVGEVRGAMILNRLGPIAGRAVVGGIEGAVGNLALEPFTYELANSLDYDYTVYDSFLNIAAGGIIGGGFHVIGGRVADYFGFGHFSRKIETGVIAPETHHSALKTAISQALQDQPVIVHPIIRSAINERFPDLNAISSIRFIKSAKDSAEVFKADYKEADALLNYYDEVKDLLTDAEGRILDATSAEDVVVAQRELVEDIQQRTTRVEELTEALNNAPYEARNHLSRAIESEYTQLQELQEVLDNLLDTRKLVNELLADVDKQVDEFEPGKRSEFKVPEETEDLILNIERLSKDELQNYGNLNKIKSKFSRLKSETDRALLRRAIMIAQDLNRLDDITPDELMDLATSQHTLESKWYYDADVVAQIDENVAQAPKDYGVDEATEALQEELKTMPKEVVEALDEFDEKIAEANELGKAIREGASCVLGGIF